MGEFSGGNGENNISEDRDSTVLTPKRRKEDEPEDKYRDECESSRTNSPYPTCTILLLYISTLKLLLCTILFYCYTIFSILKHTV